MDDIQNIRFRGTLILRNVTFYLIISLHALEDIIDVYVNKLLLNLRIISRTGSLS